MYYISFDGLCYSHLAEKQLEYLLDGLQGIKDNVEKIKEQNQSRNRRAKGLQGYGWNQKKHR